MKDKLFQEKIKNEYLGVTRQLEGYSPVEVKELAKFQLARWKALEGQHRARRNIDNLKDLAEYENEITDSFFKDCAGILKANLSGYKVFDWVSLYDDRPYPPFVNNEPLPRYILIAEEIGVPSKNFWSELLDPSARKKRIELEDEARRITEERSRGYKEREEAALAAYKQEREAAIAGQKKYNEQVDQLQLGLAKADPDAVVSCCRIALAGMMVLPEIIEVEFDLLYNPEDKILAANCFLPGPGEVPSVKKYMYSNNEHGISKKEMAKTEFNDFYDQLLLQISFSSIHIIFSTLSPLVARSAAFNGWVDGICFETGEETKICIISCCPTRESFNNLDLTAQSLKESLHGVKGIMSEPLAILTPVQPVENGRLVSPVCPETGALTGSGSGDKPEVYQPGDFKRLVREFMSEYYGRIKH